ncbi:hypothetical protein ES288_A11G326200v1 [Gossypium darwinii]|uniref:Uncharacterized protein n=1 Tax=Gossypium darwinii TaxID=34276 RepID=A0A5D2ERH9_GOSDA|nr:hypothetical protein ES288_A11G326200v1 [Gossypium darwinii]
MKKEARSTNCSRIAPTPVEISQLQNVSKPWIIKKSGILYFQDLISYSNETRNHKKVGFLAMGFYTRASNSLKGLSKILVI